ncbi:hypothetical protein KS03_5785 (plasmid) [Burkholderia glumae LMG 2196 = ATCC 33617]|nr:hypothetical protein KS03_5785 [Burkholderia glumae LMG 2196 = ATCC 33617]
MPQHDRVTRSAGPFLAEVCHWKHLSNADLEVTPGGIEEQRRTLRHIAVSVFQPQLSVARQPVGDDLARYRAGTQHTLEKALRCGLVALLLQQDIQLGAVFVDRPPQKPELATQIYEHFVQMPGAARLSSHSLDPLGEGRTKFVALSADRPVADAHAALE